MHCESSTFNSLRIVPSGTPSAARTRFATGYCDKETSCGRGNLSSTKPERARAKRCRAQAKNHIGRQRRADPLPNFVSTRPEPREQPLAVRDRCARRLARANPRSNVCDCGENRFSQLVPILKSWFHFANIGVLEISRPPSWFQSERCKHARTEYIVLAIVILENATLLLGIADQHGRYNNG